MRDGSRFSSDGAMGRGGRWPEAHVADAEACGWLALQANLTGYLWSVDGIGDEVAHLREQLACATTNRSGAVLFWAGPAAQPREVAVRALPVSTMGERTEPAEQLA